MNSKENRIEIMVCGDCLQELANGETPESADPTRDTRPQWIDCDITLGGTH